MLKDGYGKTFKRAIIRMGKTDLRLGIDKLAALLEMEYGIDPMDEGTVYLFCGTRLDRIKGLTYEGDGYVLLTKRLTSGTFRWPRNDDEAREMSQDDYERLMGGYTVESQVKSFPRIEREETEKVDIVTEISHEESAPVSIKDTEGAQRKTA